MTAPGDRFEAERAFDPETIKLLVDAYESAWASLHSSGAPFAEERYADAARDIIAKQIIGMARDGERDPRKLADGALLALSK
jgi:hypothetical protein